MKSLAQDEKGCNKTQDIKRLDWHAGAVYVFVAGEAGMRHTPSRFQSLVPLIRFTPNLCHLHLMPPWAPSKRRVSAQIFPDSSAH